MRGRISFHPVDVGFFDGLIEPLLAGEKVNPESYLEAALRVHASAWEAWRYKQALERLLEQLEPPPPPQEGTVWEKVRARLERFDHRPDPLVRLVGATVEPELHLHGRPFLVTEKSVDRAAAVVQEYVEARSDARVRTLLAEQLARLDRALAEQVEPENPDEPPAERTYRAGLLAGLKEIFDLAHAAREGATWGEVGRREPARELLVRELPWRALVLHSRAMPCWTARDVDGLETICRAAGIEAPDVLVPAWRLLARTCEEFPELRDSLHVELRGPQQLGAFVSPDDVPALITFLVEQGSRIIQAATRHGEGRACTVLLRKMRECARYAQRQGLGYCEAAGIPPLAGHVEEEEVETGAGAAC